GRLLQNSHGYARSELRRLLHGRRDGQSKRAGLPFAQRHATQRPAGQGPAAQPARDPAGTEGKSPLKIAVTGADGLLGWHMRCRLASMRDAATVPVRRDAFRDESTLARALQDADVIVHFAGMNRGSDAEIE